MTNHFTVKGMHCGSCAAKIQNALSGQPGIDSATVTFNPPMATVTTSAPVALEHLNHLVKAAGDYSLEQAAAEKPAFAVPAPGEPPVSYWPLILVFSYLTGGVLLREFQLGRWAAHEMMQNFMGGFFLVFSFFKLLDLRGFAASYASYDVIARRWMPYGCVYAFIELALGLAYLLRLNPVAVNVVTLVVMSVSSVGVIQSLLKKKKIKCACLGAVFNLPMSTVTLLEDLLMVAMAAVMLAMAH